MVTKKTVEPVRALIGCTVQLNADLCDTLKQCFDMRMDALEEELANHEVWEEEGRFLGYDNSDDFISVSLEIEKMKLLRNVFNAGAVYDCLEAEVQI